jgi:hypothetical protein
MAGPTIFNTADRIIRFAMKDAGLLQDGDEPYGEDYAQNMQRLNDILNLAQTQGLKLWLNAMQTVTLVVGTPDYVLGTGSLKPPRVIEGYYVNAQGISRPLDELSWNTYNALPNRTQQGAVTGFFTNKLQNTTTISLWLVPDTLAATGTCQMLVQNQVTNIVSLTDSMNFPAEWFMFLRWALADDISTGQPQSIVQRCSQRAETFRIALENWDVEDAATFFQPNTQGQHRRF